MRDREVRDKLPERLAKAKELLLDGASIKEASRSTGLDRSTIHKYFPGMGWTSRQAGEFRALTRYAEQKTIRRTA
jgi:hypothetical protein